MLNKKENWTVAKLLGFALANLFEANMSKMQLPITLDLYQLHQIGVCDEH